jgi:hypothetical protein
MHADSNCTPILETENNLQKQMRMFPEDTNKPRNTSVSLIAKVCRSDNR